MDLSVQLVKVFHSFFIKKDMIVLNSNMSKLIYFSFITTLP